jgi:glycosyltransferase involved in cell wall biosynthesis
MAAKGWSAGLGHQLTVHHVPTLSHEADLDLRGCGPRNVFLRRSWLFARAAQAAYQLQPFDAIEVFDYVGVGFELTRRLAEWRQAVTRGDAAAAMPPYVPEHVPILVRLHGSVQLIHQHEGLFVEEASARTPRPCLLTDSEREAWPLMYLMEQYALRAAHLLLPQSRAMQAVYAQAYGVSEGRMLLAPPPMARITAPMRAAARRAPALFAGVEDVARLRRAGAAAGAAVDAAAELRLLVYGRVMRVKGAETIAAAASAIQAALPAGIVLRLVFAGLDWECPLHRRPTSQCVLELLSGDARSSFLGQLDKSALTQLLPTVHGAVFASEFETFGMAVHELAAAGLPLIVSNIPAFAEFFSPRNAYVFASGDPVSLAKAVGELFSDLEGGTLRFARLDYADAVAPYERVFAACRQSGGISAAAGDMRLLDAAIARLEEECWPAENAECDA